MYNIPSDSPYYGPWLDNNHDGIGCEKNQHLVRHIPEKP